MNIRRFLMRVVIGALLLGLDVCRLANAREPEIEATVPLYEFLERMAVKFDCYFTIEEMFEPDDDKGLYWIGLCEIDNKDNEKTLDALLASLRKKLKEADVIQSTSSSAVVHIVDKRLNALKGYVLEDQISLGYEGTPGEFVQTLTKKYSKAIHHPYGGIIGGWPGTKFDYVTKIRVPDVKMAIRRKMPDYLQLSGYERILWHALTFPEKGKYETSVQFFGSAPKQFIFSNVSFDARHDQSNDHGTGIKMVDGLVEFKWGQVAFTNNFEQDDPEKQEKMAKAAIKFIKERMEKKEPLQVRWAMFYLGKAKAKDGIPILLKYVDYKYTNWGILEESYPALKALRQIGPPAAEAALAEIGKETNDLRLELFAKSLVAVHGLEKTKRLLQAKVDSTCGKVEKKHYAAALEKVVNDSKRKE